MILRNNYNNSNPLVLHMNGQGKWDMWNRNNFEGFDKSFTRLIIESHRIIKPDNLTILTYVTNNMVENKTPLIKQLKYWEVDYVNICDHYSGEWDNLCKIEYLYQYLKEGNVTTDYIIVLDSVDILLTQNFDEVVDRFLKHNVNIMYGATPVNYPKFLKINDTLELNPGYSFEKVTKSMFNYLNSGTVIGKTDTMTEFMGICNENINREDNYLKSDQLEIRINFEKHHIDLNMGYDYDTDLFFTVGWFWTLSSRLRRFSNDNGTILFEIGETIKSDRTML